MGGLVLTSVAYCLLVGADFFSYHRFLLPALAPVTLLFWWFGVGANATRRASEHRAASAKPSVVLLAALFLLVQLVYFVGRFWPPQGVVHKVIVVDNTQDWGLIAREFNRTLPPDAMIATIPIGAMGYFSHRYILDMVGLTDTHIAHRAVPTGMLITGHEKYDIDYVLARAPALIYTWPCIMAEGAPGLEDWVSSNVGAEAQMKMMSDARTRVKYRLCWLPMGSRGGVIGLIRRDLFGQPAWRMFQPIPPEYDEWVWYAFDSKNIPEMFRKVAELRRSLLRGEKPETPELNRGVVLPIGPRH